jgi:hypothetical protein
VGVPGPPGGLWAVSLLLWGVAAAVVGEALRGSAGRWVASWRSLEPIERFLLDLYLGGATMYAVAALEVGAFVRPVVLAIPAIAAAALVYRAREARRRGSAATARASFREAVTDRWALVAVGSALGLFVVELAEALPVATGNTYDSSLLTTYVAILLQHGSVPLSFRPFGSSAILYPQGATVWLAWAQLDFGLPAARTALLVTPLFLALAPLSGYVLGKRMVGSSRAGAAFALALAWLGPSTRALVGGSNDFVLAFPLILLLSAQIPGWASKGVPRVGDTVGFGLLLGYAAVLNVVGTEWLLPAIVLVGAFSTPAFGGRPLAWWGRWATVFACALVAGIPALYVLLAARRTPSSLAGALSTAPGSSVGITTAQWVGSVDPFLFRARDVELSPVPIVRLELAALIVLGVVALVVVTQSERRRWGQFVRWAAAAGLAIVGWLVALVAAGAPGSPLRELAYISSAGELSVGLFATYGLLAAVPLALAFDRLPDVRSGAAPGEGRPRGSGRPSSRPGLRALAPVAVALVIVVPALVLTPTSLGPVLSSLYTDFGNVSAADFAMLAYAGSHLPPGSRVLVAPGSAGEFLPGYARGVVLLFPMAPGFSDVNRSYSVVLQELSNGTLDAVGRTALASLDLDFLVVTGNNTVLWPALWAAPLVHAEVNGTRTFPTVFQEGDAWIFNASACRPGSPGCP